mgnify:CR=1 FL=1
MCHAIHHVTAYLISVVVHHIVYRAARGACAGVAAAACVLGLYLQQPVHGTASDAVVSALYVPCSTKGQQLRASSAQRYIAHTESATAQCITNWSRAGILA